MFAAFLTTILWSISAVSGSRTSRRMGGIRANFWRLVVAVLFLAAYAHTQGDALGGSAIEVFFLSGVIGIGFGDVALYEAYPKLGPRLTILLVQCGSAPFAALLEWIWMGTVLTPAQMLYGAGILVGVGIALSEVPGEHAGSRRFMMGIVFAVLAALGNAAGAVLSRKAFATLHAAGESMDAMTAAYQRVLGGLAVAVIAFVVFRLHQVLRAPAETAANSSPSHPKRIWPWIVVNGLSGLGLGMTCYQWALREQPTGVVLPIVAITPIMTIPFTRYLDGERPGWRSLTGGFIAVAAAFGLAGGFALFRRLLG